MVIYQKTSTVHYNNVIVDLYIWLKGHQHVVTVFSHLSWNWCHRIFGCWISLHEVNFLTKDFKEVVRQGIKTVKVRVKIKPNALQTVIVLYFLSWKVTTLHNAAVCKSFMWLLVQCKIYMFLHTLFTGKNCRSKRTGCKMVSIWPEYFFLYTSSSGLIRNLNCCCPGWHQHFMLT